VGLLKTLPRLTDVILSEANNLLFQSFPNRRSFVPHAFQRGLRMTAKAISSTASRLHLFGQVVCDIDHITSRAHSPKLSHVETPARIVCPQCIGYDRESRMPLVPCRTDIVPGCLSE